MTTSEILALTAQSALTLWFIQRSTDAARAEAACATAAALRAETDAQDAARNAAQCRHMLSELTADGSPLMRAVAALPRKRTRKEGTP